MENKFGLNIDYEPKDSVNFLEDIGILEKTTEGTVTILMLRMYKCMHT